MVRSAALSVVLAFLAAGTAGAQGLPAGSFDPKAPSDHYKALLGTKLTGPNALQSFAFDEAARAIYVVQTVKGAKPAGDLYVNRIDYGGKLKDAMRLNGFGHGVTVGVTHESAGVFIWIESVSRSSGGGDGFGTRVARVPYRAGKAVTPTSAGVVDVTPPGTAGRSPRPTIDPVTGRLVVRYTRKSGVYGFVAVPTADAVAHRWTALQHLGYANAVGEPKPGGGASTSQGSTVAGTVAYLYFGESYDHVAKPGNAHIRAVRLVPGKVSSGPVGYTYSLKSLEFREPEGITVQVNGGAPRLVFGFASDDGSGRLANFSYKQRWTPDVVPAPAPPPTPAPAPAPAPVPTAPAVLRAHPRLVTSTALRSRRMRVRVSGLDGLARVRVTARVRGRTVTLYAATRRVTATGAELTLRLNRLGTRRLRKAHITTRARITVSLGGQVARASARLPR